MPRRRRRVSRLSLFYFVVTLGILVGGSVWLDRRGEVTTARVESKHEEIAVQQVPAGGWIRWYRVGVASSGNAAPLATPSARPG